MNETFPLGLLEVGDIAEIAEDPGQRLEQMGLRTGKIVKMLNNAGRGPLLLKVDESRMALARRWAMAILVRKAP